MANKRRRLGWGKHREWAGGKVLWTDKSKLKVFGSNRRLRVGNEKMLEVCLTSVKNGGEMRCSAGDKLQD